MQYEEDDMLMLSGIQHFAFCPRQWALIHIDQQWDENRLTIEGEIMHQHVDDPFYRQKLGSNICLRSVSIASKQLGLYGLSDVIELHPTDSPVNAILHPKYPGYWLPYPIEYKHGRPKSDNIDAVQLAAQGMCIEEQYGIRIPEGAIFYGEVRNREIVEFSDVLRSEVVRLAGNMHELFSQRKLPKAEKRPHCKNCSIKDICLPKLAEKRRALDYLKTHLYEETT